MKITTSNINSLVSAGVIIIFIVGLFVFATYTLAINNDKANDLAKSYCEEKDQTFFLRNSQTSTFKCLDKDKKVFEYGLTEKENTLGEKEQWV